MRSPSVRTRAASTPSSDVPDIVPSAQTGSAPNMSAPWPFPLASRADIRAFNRRMDDPAMTYHPKSDFMRVMIERGFLADCTDYQGLDEALAKGVVPAYIGFDATAESLHVGSL